MSELQPNNRKFLLVLFLVVLVDLFAVALVVPLLYRYAMAVGADPESYGLLGSLFSAAQLVGSPFMGVASDRLGRKTALLINFVGAGVSYVGMAFAPTFLVLCLWRIPVGFVKQTVTISVGYVAELTEPAKRAGAIGRMKSAVSLAFVAGPAVGGYLATFDLKLPAVVSSALYGLNFVAVYFCLPDVRKSREAAAVAPPAKRTSFASALRAGQPGTCDGEPETDPCSPSELPTDEEGNLHAPTPTHPPKKKSGLLLGIKALLHSKNATVTASVATAVCLEAGEKIMRFSLPIFLYDNLNLEVQQVGVFHSTSGALSTLMGAIGVTVVTKYMHGDRNVVRYGAGVTACATLAMTVYPVSFLFFPAYAAYVTSLFCAETCLLSILTHEVDDDQVGTALGVLDSLNSLVGVVMPLVSGYLAARNRAYPAALTCVCCICAAAISLTRIPRRPAASPGKKDD
ncbi:Tetracycline resistance protein [Diplonema papillatum]|nr:Tetracycline resistance protein [Diplonema papillatum]